MKTLSLVIIVLSFSTVVFSQKVVIPMGQNIKEERVMPISEIAESIRLIPLETSKNCLFDTDISKIEIVEENIFVSDFNYIFRYDLNGNFLNRIGKKGKGPGEYSPAFQTFLIDKKDRNLIIFEMNGRRMIKYDFEGNFVAEKKVNFPPGRMEWISDENFAIYNMGFTFEKEPWYDFYILNPDAKIIQKNRFKKQAEKRYGLNIYPPVFYQFNGKTRYKNPHEDVIYELDEKGKATPVFQFDYGKYEKYNNVDDVEVQVKNNVGTNRSNPKSFEKIGLLGLSETDNYLFIYYGHQEQRKAGVYNKRDKTFYNLFDPGFQMCGFQDDLNQGLPIFPTIGIQKNILFSSYTAFEFKEALKKSKKMSAKLADLVENLAPNDNPVLVLVKLKE